MLEDIEKKGMLRCPGTLQRNQHWVRVYIGAAFPIYIRNLKGRMRRAGGGGDGRKERGREGGEGSSKHWVVPL